MPMSRNSLGTPSAKPRRARTQAFWNSRYWGCGWLARLARSFSQAQGGTEAEAYSCT